MNACLLGLLVVAVLSLVTQMTWAAEPSPSDMKVAGEKTSQGDLTVQPINHSAIRFEFKGRQYYVDPAGEADWDKMPKADAIFITHEHFDHLNPKVIDQIKKEGTVICANAASVKKAGFGQTIEVGEKKQVLDITVEAGRLDRSSWSSWSLARDETRPTRNQPR